MDITINLSYWDVFIIWMFVWWVVAFIGFIIRERKDF